MLRNALAALAALAAGPDMARSESQPAQGRPAIGVNLNGIANYSNENPFLDRFKNAGSWYIHGGTYSGYNPAPADLFDANGWPKGQPAGSSYSINLPLEALSKDHPAHRWILTYSGTAKFEWNSRASVVSNAPGRLVFDATDTNVDFGITTTDANPIHDAHLVRQDQLPLLAQGLYLNPDFIALMKHFSALRTMDWTCTNGSQVVSWSQRAVLAKATWGCVPLEVQIAAANAASADLWLNVPAHVDDDYIRQAVTMVRDKLAPGLKLHLEYSNEMWNLMFEQSKWAQAQADAKWGADSPQWVGREQWYGYRAAQMAKIAHDVFGASSDARLSVVLAGFVDGDSSITTQMALGVGKANVGTIAVLFKEYAITTYFGEELGYSADAGPNATLLGWYKASDLDGVFYELERGGTLPFNASLAHRASTYAFHAARAKAWGLKLVAYEGGFSWFYFQAPDKTLFDAFLPKLLADPRAGVLTTKMVQDFGNAGGTLLMQFSDIGVSSQWGPWGMQPDLFTQTPRSKALIQASGK